MSKEENEVPADVKELVRWAERTQRNLEFITNQQAQFSADMQRSGEEQEERRREADEKWARTEAGVRALLAIAQSHEGEINALREAQERTDRQIAETGRQMAETGRRMAETDERLSALMNFAERFAGERRGGGPEGREGLRR